MAHAFISYSHSDAQAVHRLEVHMSQLKREGLLSTWFDGEILAGGSLDADIFAELEKADIFLAVISPDYLNSAYCYDIEFQQALRAVEAGKIRIVPIIAQPCDWKSSPFGRFKAIPKDGKPVSEWTNENNAFLNVIDELRKLVSAAPSIVKKSPVVGAVSSKSAYRIKKDFDPVDLLNFREETFELIHSYFVDAVEEINDVDQIKARFVQEVAKQHFTCVVTNRAKIGTTGYISIGVQHRHDHFGQGGITYSLAEQLNINVMGNSFSIEHDEYELFWSRRNLFDNHKAVKLNAKEIAETLWDEFIDQVGINR